VTLFINPYNLNETSMRIVNVEGGGAAAVQASAKSLATLVREEGFTRIDAIKLDVEGAEDLVLDPFLSTAPRTLWPRLIVMEFALLRVGAQLEQRLRLELCGADGLARASNPAFGGSLSPFELPKFVQFIYADFDERERRSVESASERFTRSAAARNTATFISNLTPHQNSYAKVAEGCGLKGVTVKTQSELTEALRKSCEDQKKGITTFIEVVLNQELGEPFRRDAMKKPVVVAGIKREDMRPQQGA